MAVLSPLKLKLSPGICGSGNLNLADCHPLHIGQSAGRRGREVREVWRIYQKLRLRHHRSFLRSPACRKEIHKPQSVYVRH